MKQVIGFVLLGVLCANAVQANGNEETRAEAEVQSEVLVDDRNLNSKAKAAVQSGRIVNGVVVNIDNYSFAVSLRLDGRYYCGGSIISLSHVLTAAHCVYPFLTNFSRMSVYGGSTSPFTGGISLPVVRAAIHPDFNPNPSSGLYDVDVAVLTVPRNAFRGRPNMAPIALRNVDVQAGTWCFAVGWGWTDYNAPATASELRYANMYIVAQDSCVSIYSQFSQPINPNMLCAKARQGVDTCRGDSGSALVCGGRLTGINSFTNGNCNGFGPAGYARVAYPSIRNFIRVQTGF